MAATCPKCGGKLRLIDWKPICPHCGVNMVYYGMEERLLLDADKAEAEHARTQPKIDRIKAATVGSPLAIVRLVLSLVPIAGLFLPLCNFAFQAPFASYSGSINVIKLYNAVSATDMDALLGMFSSKLFGQTMIFYAVAVVCLVLSALGILLHTIFQTLACSPKGKVRNFTFDVLNLGLAVGAMVCFTQFSSHISALLPSVIRTSALGFGAFVYLGLLLLSFAVDILCVVKGVPVKYTECFVGNIPAEKYFKLVEEGVPLDHIRMVMAEHAAQKEAAESEKKAAEEAAKKAEEAEKETVAAE